MRPSVRRSLGVLTAAVSSAALLTACGSGSESAAGGDSSITLGFVNGANTEFHTCLQRAIASEAKASGVEVLTANSNQNPGTELSNIEDMISRQVDALIVQTVNVDALEGDIAKAKSANIPIFLTSVVAKDTTDILGAVVVDLPGEGKLNSDWVAEDAAGAQVKAGVIAGAPGAASDLLIKGFTDALPANVTVVANQPGMFNRTKAQEVAENMIQAHPDLNYLFVANEEMAFGALNAFQAANASVKIVTMNGTDAGLVAIKEGKFSATVANSPTTTGTMAVRNTLALLKGEKIEKIAQSPIKLITKENAGEAPAYCLES
ncbi:sugar ABC transporter substrate-binding protein [Planomonospora venezuelensis]|uniref:Ribose transport system substrate-binding protein n=1 Tax=Planomonospora venezuelensis TaxID=1999 RepID=A0A841DF44_PLAVE|nr:substrate-binding domain-containing protein [Planomonospora venezuelensis]MBB5967373.1 ribose transport system substrate-binding protein [Planomonospora venezuelensis]GIN03141.1 D-ribose ABC transporter substrate-binding protein [Planomonospora venezuelensis]